MKICAWWAHKRVVCLCKIVNLLSKHKISLKACRIVNYCKVNISIYLNDSVRYINDLFFPLNYFLIDNFLISIVIKVIKRLPLESFCFYDLCMYYNINYLQNYNYKTLYYSLTWWIDDTWGTRVDLKFKISAITGTVKSSFFS